MKSGERTKEKIGSAFKKLMIDRPFDSITITDITDACSLNRLTFYYHFQDKYDLMNWIFYKDVIDPIRGSIDVDNWRPISWRSCPFLFGCRCHQP